MNALKAVMGVTAAAVAALMFLLWLASLMKKDASIVDTFWGLGFVMIASIANVLGDGFDGRQFITTMLVGLWGLRLSWHIALRASGLPEDSRYRSMRERAGGGFWWKSLFTVFLTQGAVMWVVSWPIQYAQMAAAPSSLTMWDGLGLLLFAAGFILETVADEQLRHFKTEPNQAGRVMDRGLWRYSRHPNYFGEAVLWWGLALPAAALPGGGWTIVSPILMTLLLLRVSGVPMLEPHLKATRPGYEDYVRRTSAFIPRAPRAEAPSTGE